MSRLAAQRARHGARTWFVEEPVTDPACAEPRIRTEQFGAVTRAWLVAPPLSAADDRYISFEHPAAARYPQLLREIVPRDARLAPDVWVYTPMAYELAAALPGCRRAARR